MKSISAFLRTLPLTALLLLGGGWMSWAQDRTITGKVTDAGGDPVYGAVVMAQTGGSSIGEMTDENGQYSISSAMMMS